MTNGIDYGAEAETRAAEFCARYGVAVAIKPTARQVPPDWWTEAGGGIRYRVTLSRADWSPVRFFYWGSDRDRQEGRAASVADVLTCCAMDLYCPEDVDEFASEYGFDLASAGGVRGLLRLFRRADSQARRLRAFFFDYAEREALQGIDG